MSRYDDDLIDDDNEDEDEETLEEAKARRQKRLNNKKTHCNKQIIAPKFRMEKVKKKAYRPKISWEDYTEDDDFLDY